MLLPTYDGSLKPYTLTNDPLIPRAPVTPFSRIAFAAAHVTTDPMTDLSPWLGRPSVDWDATLRIRHSLWDQGLGLAEAMDTAQRGMGMDWLTAKELIERTMKDAKAHALRPRVVCGAGTDHALLSDLKDENAVLNAYRHQMEAIESVSGQIILMATRALPAICADADAYARIYSTLLTEAQSPVILHWLGEAFDPALTGYWGNSKFAQAKETVLGIIRENAAKVDGIKISLLEPSKEKALRASLPDGVRLYTGDDFNYVDLIEGDGDNYSDALLGIFAAIAPAASQALEALAENDRVTFRTLLEPTVALSHEIFCTPTQFYKAGIGFLAWLNGAQNHFVMPAGFQSSRSIVHYAEVFRLADQARLLVRPDLATKRMTQFLTVYGVNQ